MLCCYCNSNINLYSNYIINYKGFYSNKIYYYIKCIYCGRKNYIKNINSIQIQEPMEVIENNYKEISKEVICEKCNSKLKITANDLFRLEDPSPKSFFDSITLMFISNKYVYKYYYFCPCCSSINYINSYKNKDLIDQFYR